MLELNSAGFGVTLTVAENSSDVTRSIHRLASAVSNRRSDWRARRADWNRDQPLFFSPPPPSSGASLVRTGRCRSLDHLVWAAAAARPRGERLSAAVGLWP